MSYDSELRRNTPLAVQLKQRVVQHGPLSVAQYMHACLHDETHGYYRVREAVGGAADFITAPEISQVFGELIGLWCAVVWQQMGSPGRINIIELGPGRGTMIADALRAARILPNFIEAIDLHLIESARPARAAQRDALNGSTVPASWHEDLADVPAGPSIVLGNEFLDVLPIEQFIRRDGQWHRRAVAVDGNDQLYFSDLAVDPRMSGKGGPIINEGTVMEAGDFTQLLQPLLTRAGNAPLAALFLDYGHLNTQLGDTLQAVRAHHHEHPLTSPGEADLTCQVNFQDLVQQAGALGSQMGTELAIDGPVTQGAFLGGLGIIERTSKLLDANRDKAGEIESAIARLLAPQGMGSRFKAIGMRSPGLPVLPGLPASSAPEQGPDQQTPTQTK